MPELSTKANAKRYEWKDHPFRRAVLRGLTVVLPPPLTPDPRHPAATLLQYMH